MVCRRVGVWGNEGTGEKPPMKQVESARVGSSLARMFSSRWWTGSRRAYLTVDLNQRIVYWNHGAEKINGYLSQEMGRSCGSNLVVELIEHNPATCAHPCPAKAASANTPGTRW